MPTKKAITRRQRKPRRRTGRGTGRKAPRVRLSDEQLTEIDAYVRANCDESTAATYFALERNERRARMSRMLEHLAEREILASEDEGRWRERQRIDLEVRYFDSLLALVESRRALTMEVMVAALSENAPALLDEADEVLRDLDRARASALAGMKALARVSDRWEQGIGAACCRLLYEHLCGRAATDTIEAVAEQLGKPTQTLREWLAAHEGDRKADGAQLTADKAIAALVGVTDRTVRRWREEPCGRYFDRLIAAGRAHGAGAREPCSPVERLFARNELAKK